MSANIAHFFHEYGPEKPGGVNRSHDILRNMFDYAIAWGHWPEAAGNSCIGIVRYRRPLRGSYRTVSPERRPGRGCFTVRAKTKR